MSGDERENHGGDGGGKHPDRQLHDPSRPVQHRGRLVVQGQTDEPGNRDVDQVDGRADQGRPHQTGDLPHPVVGPQVEARPPALLPEHRGGYRHLQKPAEQDANAEEIHARRLTPRPCAAEREGGNDGEIEPNRRQRRFAKPPEHLAGRAERRCETDKGQIRKQQDRQVSPEQQPVRGIGFQPKSAQGAQQGPGMGAGQHGQRDQRHRDHQQPTGHLADEIEGCTALPVLQLVRHRRDKCRGQRTFAEEAAEQVGQGESRDKGRAQRTGAKHRRDSDLPHQAQHARHHGGRGDDTDVFQVLRHVRGPKQCARWALVSRPTPLSPMWKSATTA